MLTPTKVHDVRSVEWKKISFSLKEELASIQQQLKNLKPTVPFELRKKQLHYLGDNIFSFKLGIVEDGLFLECTYKYLDKQSKVRFCNFDFKLNTKYYSEVVFPTYSTIIWEGYDIVQNKSSSLTVYEDKHVVSSQDCSFVLKKYSYVSDVVKKEIKQHEQIIMGATSAFVQEHKALLDEISKKLEQSRDLLKNKKLIEQTQPLFDQLSTACLNNY